MMLKSANISVCGKYRYRLDRVWDHSLPILAFVMLNPSTADAEKNDPTIRKCIGFAKHNGYGGIVVVNLYAFRATDPRDLFAAASPIGVSNHKTLLEVLRDDDNVTAIVCAWGNDAPEEHARWVYNNIIYKTGKPILCIKRNASGSPRHPARVPYGGLQPYELD